MKSKGLSALISESRKILITSHISPDPDAIGSLIYVYRVLKENFPDKQIAPVIEGPISESFSFIKGFEGIERTNLLEKMKMFEPDLLVMLDVNAYDRISKNDFEEVESIIESKKIKTVVIDHHLTTKLDNKINIYINNACSSTAQEVYKIFKEDLKLDQFENYGDSVMFGIVGDTGRFLYKNDGHRETFRITSDLIDSGVDIERLQSSMGSLKPVHTLILSELFKNFSQQNTYNFSYLSDEFVSKLLVSKVTVDEYNLAYNLFNNQYIRSIEPNKWGFLIIPDIASGKEGTYRGSFRSINGVIDTTVFSKLLGGGGHKLASGFTITAKDYKEALQIVHNTIKENLEEALRNA